MKREASRIKGSFRLRIRDGDGTIVGDSGWVDNLITNEGFRNVTRLMGALAGSSAFTHLAVGTGAAPIATDTTLAGEQSARAAMTNSTSSTSKALQMLATFASAASFVTATKSLSNLGAFGTVTAATGTLFSGNTFASSACATNQQLEVTYSWSFT